MSSGFFVPNSRSSDYVKNKKTREGDYQYERSLAQIGLSNQAMLQNVKKNYATSINQAYSDYITGRRSLAASQMGSGYKEAYNEILQKNFTRQAAEANMNNAAMRQQLGQSREEAEAEIEKQFQREVSYMDRVATSAEGYLDYLNSLIPGSDKVPETYFTGDKAGKTIDYLYQDVLGAAPQGYTDTSGNVALTYDEWLSKNYKNKTDEDWKQWLYGGGLSQFKYAVSKGIE